MIATKSPEHPRQPHMELVAAINNIGMCAHNLKLTNEVMARACAVLRKHRASFVDKTPEGISIDHFVDLAETMAAELAGAEIYSPDVGAALSAVAAKLPQAETVSGEG